MTASGKVSRQTAGCAARAPGTRRPTRKLPRALACVAGQPSRCSFVRSSSHAAKASPLSSRDRRLEPAVLGPRSCLMPEVQWRITRSGSPASSFTMRSSGLKRRGLGLGAAAVARGASGGSGPGAAPGASSLTAGLRPESSCSSRMPTTCVRRPLISRSVLWKSCTGTLPPCQMSRTCSGPSLQPSSKSLRQRPRSDSCTRPRKGRSWQGRPCISSASSFGQGSSMERSGRRCTTASQTLERSFSTWASPCEDMTARIFARASASVKDCVHADEKQTRP
mmetsp:Transcript_90285/g.292183  ORF Transcript_90285/g.292183 Transcript_90285/m.292183 type:complete len:279 (+) Transcript_90285:268-1104(+)